MRKLKRSRTIEENTCLLTFMIADAVVRELGVYLHFAHGLDLEGPDELAEGLAAKAAQLYAVNDRVYTAVNRISGRDRLYTFMRHWLAGALHSPRNPGTPNHRKAAALLPDRFAMGNPAPSPTPEQITARSKVTV